MPRKSSSNGYLGKNPTQFYCSAWGYMPWNIPLVTLGQLSQLCHFPALGHLAYSLTGQSRKQRRPWCCVSTTQWKSIHCYQYCFVHRSERQHHIGWYEESQFHPSQSQYIPHSKWTGMLFFCIMWIEPKNKAQMDTPDSVVKSLMSSDDLL